MTKLLIQITTSDTPDNNKIADLHEPTNVLMNIYRQSLGSLQRIMPYHATVFEWQLKW